MNEEEILAAAKKLHDAEVGERHCDARYLRSCPVFTSAVLRSGRAVRQTPERCGQRHVTAGDCAVVYTCDIAAGHRSEFHLDTGQLATWSHAGDLVRHTSLASAALVALVGTQPVSLQHDACGARLAVTSPKGIGKGTRGEWVCALGEQHQGMQHRASDGTQWDHGIPVPVPQDLHRMYLSPPALERAVELEQLAYSEEGGALNLGPIIERQRQSADVVTPQQLRAILADVMPLVREVMRLRRKAAERPPTGPDATIRSAVDGISTQIDAMTAVFAELREAVDSGQLDAVRAVLRDAGLGYGRTPAHDVRDLAGQRDGALEHADNCEKALVRIADMARQALGRAEPLGDTMLASQRTTLRNALARIVAVTEENDR
jgi:hypothetical protein